VIKGGLLSLAGALEYAPTFQAVDLRHATIRDVRLDWVHDRGDRVRRGRRQPRLRRPPRKSPTSPTC